jgi:hypothetical protein
MKTVLTRCLVLLFLEVICYGEEPGNLKNYDEPVFGAKVVLAHNAMELTKDQRKQMPTQLGVLLLDIHPYGIAGLAKCEKNDIITHVNKKPIKTVEEFSEAISDLDAGEKCELVRYRMMPQAKPLWKKETIKAGVILRRGFILSQLRATPDENKGHTFYFPKDAKPLTYQGNAFTPVLIVSKTDSLSIELLVQYGGRESISMRKVKILVGDQTYSFTPPSVSKDFNNRGVTESCSFGIDEAAMKVLKEIVQTESAGLYLEGEDDTKRRNLTPLEIDHVRVVLDAYALMSAGK